MDVLGIIAAIVVMYITYKVIFGSWDELADALAFWLQPDFISWFQGQGLEDFFAELKLGVWILSGVGAYLGTLALTGV